MKRTVLASSIFFAAGVLFASWDEISGPREPSGSAFKIDLKCKLEGKWDGDFIVFEGKTKIEDKRLKQFLKQQEYDQFLLGPIQSVGPQGDDEFSQGSFGFGLQLIEGGFKLRATQPPVPTQKVSVEVFMGELQDPDFIPAPHLEAFDLRLNPFKFAKMEPVMTAVTALELREIRISVRCESRPGDAKDRDQNFKADFDGYMIMGDVIPYNESTGLDQDIPDSF